MPKFLIDDVIPEEGLVLRQWDQRFWIQRPFLYKNTPTWFLFYVFYNCNFRYFYVSYASKYHPKMAKGAKVTSPGSSTLHLALVCVCETLWYTQTLKSHNFAKKNFFLMRFFLFVPYDWALSNNIIFERGKNPCKFPFKASIGIMFPRLSTRLQRKFWNLTERRKK